MLSDVYFRPAGTANSSQPAADTAQKKLTLFETRYRGVASPLLRQRLASLQSGFSESSALDTNNPELLHFVSTDSSATSHVPRSSSMPEAIVLAHRRAVRPADANLSNRDAAEGRSSPFHSHPSRAEEPRNLPAALAAQTLGRELSPPATAANVRWLTEQDVPALTTRIYGMLVDQIQRQKRMRGL
jgi:hypothetical protein